MVRRSPYQVRGEHSGRNAFRVERLGALDEDDDAPDDVLRPAAGVGSGEVIKYTDHKGFTKSVARVAGDMHGVTIAEMEEFPVSNVIYLDLETADADRLWDYGTGFVRLAGIAVNNGPVMTTTDISAVTRIVERADLIVGHNVLAFDLPALERYHGLDLGNLVEHHRVIDTHLVARQNDPPLSGKSDVRRYNLEALAQKVLGEGKVASEGTSVLKSLAKEFGGFDKIPTDHPDYIRYLIQDVELVRELSKSLVVDDYVLREHKVLWRLSHITRQGFRVDLDLAKALIAQRETRTEQQKQKLHEVYGLPMGGKKPHTTVAGRAALEKAFADLGVQPVRTKTREVATGKDAMNQMIEEHSDYPAVVELCQTLLAFNGERSTAQTILQNTRSEWADSS